jgi:hypothetical protein
MPRPFDQISWGLNSVQRAIAQSTGQAQIPAEALAVFKEFDQAFSGGRSFSKAMEQEIRWMKDGRSFPWSVGGSRPPAAIQLDRQDKDNIKLAGVFQKTYTDFRALLDKADNDKTLSYQETQDLGDLLKALLSGVKTCVSATEHMREENNNARPTYEILQTIKNQVNEISNDVKIGTFRTFVKFGKAEAESFIKQMEWQVTNWDKRNEVIESLFDIAVSPYGNLILDRGAAEVFKSSSYAGDLKWDTAINHYKDEHPIVALYAVAIDTAMRDGASDAELRSMLNAGNAAVTELRASFVNGSVFRGMTTLSADATRVRALSAGAREVEVQKLEAALKKLATHLGVS